MELNRLIEFVREDDEVWVHSIDRLARSLIDLHEIVNKITSKGASVYFKSENLIFDSNEANPHHTLYFQMLGAFAQFERGIFKQRQAEGIAKAKERGAYSSVGRKGLSNDIKSEIKSLIGSGIGPTKVASKLGLSRATIYRVLQ